MASPFDPPRIEHTNVDDMFPRWRVLRVSMATASAVLGLISLLLTLCVMYDIFASTLQVSLFTLMDESFYVPHFFTCLMGFVHVAMCSLAAWLFWRRRWKYAWIMFAASFLLFRGLTMWPSWFI